MEGLGPWAPCPPPKSGPDLEGILLGLNPGAADDVQLNTEVRFTSLIFV